LKKEYETIFNDCTPHEEFVKKYTCHMNSIQDFMIKNKIDCYRMLSNDQMNSKTEWSIKEFFELDFSIVPDIEFQENQNSKNL
jgi:hypothetical protein